MQAVRVEDQSQIAEARRTAAAVAGRLGFSATDGGRVAIVATELATNLLRHGGGGQMLVGRTETGAGPAVEVLALDRGPGMRDVQECCRDGYSTAGTPGNGLGAVARQSTVMDVWSRPGGGTAVLSRIAAAPALLPPLSPTPRPAPLMDVGVVQRPMPGEEACGDGWAVETVFSDVTVLMVADGLGHGPLAADAATMAIRLLHRHRAEPAGAIVRALHDGLQSTRGAAVAVARVDHGAGAVTYCGIGNIAGVLLAGGRVQKMVSHNGTAGLSARRIQEFTYPFAGTPLVILHSDGLGSSWGLDAYPGLAVRDPSLLAGVLYRDFDRGRDDVTVLVARGRP